MSQRKSIRRKLLRALVPATVIGDENLGGGSHRLYVLEQDRWSHRQLLLDQAQRAGVLLGPSQILCARRNGEPVLAEQLEQLCRHCAEDPGYRLELIPVSIFHGRLPIRETSWLNLLYAESWDQGGRIGRVLQLLVNGRQTLIHIDPPLRLQALRETEQDAGRLLRKATLMLQQHFRTRRRAVVGPDLSHRRTLMSLILRHPQVRRAIAGRARERRESEREAEQYAQRELNRIAANFSPVTTRLLYPLFNAVWKRLYDDVEVLGLEPLRELALDHQLVYLPCHRSHLDYLLMSWALYRHGLMLPHIAAGENLDLPLVGGILKRGGAIFMRRSFQDDPLYHALYQQYMTLMAQHGHALEYFIEGGRSRTGRLLPPRAGLLTMTLDAWRARPEKPVALVPVWIGYDRVVEAHSYQRELEGAEKRKESLGGLVAALGVLRQKFGRVTLSIGEPMPLEQHLDLRQPTRAQVPAITQRIMSHINGAGALTESGALATVLLAQLRLTMSSAQLHPVLMRLQELAQALPNAPATVPDSTPAAWIRAAAARGQLDTDGSRTWLNAGQAREMTFYRNNMMHLWTLPGLCLLLVRRSDNPLPQLITLMLKVLYPYLRSELFLPWDDDDFTPAAARTRQALIARGLLRLDGRRLVAEESDAALTLMRTAEPVLLRYYALFRLLERRGAIEMPALLDASQALTERLQREFGFDSPEYADRRVLRGFIDLLLDRAILRCDRDRVAFNTDVDGLMRQARQVLTAHLVAFIDEQLDEV
ncbi:glycerol-3-phosphate acyltransferase [Marinobacterium nitratireducens]|uniref:Glycerol-3-phosphate acyltransferase n=1 Tax=Marinobacterium nitratireducens TaxID=518897 RepID=A0A918DTW2_9GAMM|nr:glycerol-3-phosphate 1-O-acyltransferase PlsB [Marinobacterium nitratireducens]GGO82155.1 glycerol-3-phosphate acyltransferase [Marinobacterium nitratireducens]